MRGLLYLASATSVTVLAIALVIFLLQEGETGNAIAGPLSLFVAVLTLIVTVVIKLVDDGIIRVVRPRQRLVRPIKVAGVLVILLVLATSIFTVPLYNTEKDIPATMDVTMENSYMLSSGEVATARIREPKRRTALSLTPTMSSSDPQLGNCTGSSTLEVVVIFDGVPRQRIPDATPGRELRFSTEGAVGTVAVEFTPVIPYDLTCRVDIAVAEAHLYTGD